jgi:midasin
LYAYQILALLFGIKQIDLNRLNVPLEVQLKCQMEDIPVESSDLPSSSNLIEWYFSSNVITNIEDVLLSIFDKENFNFYHANTEKYDNLVKVDSTKINLRSLALWISSGKAICLSGPVGSGKTSLFEYFARQTGRLAPKIREFQKYLEEKSSMKENVLENFKKNRRKFPEPQNGDLLENIEKVTPKNENSVGRSD